MSVRALAPERQEMADRVEKLGGGVPSVILGGAPENVYLSL
jgi:hypothetical protein